MALVDQPAVGRGDHAVPRGEPAEDFDDIAVAAAELDRAPGRAAAGLVDHEHPISAAVVEEGAVGDEDRRRRIADGQLRLHRLAALDCAGFDPVEYQVDLELAVADLRIDLGDLEPVGFAVDVRRRALADRHPSKIEFVDVRLELVGAGAVDLSDSLPLLERLAELDLESAELPGDGRADVELAEAASGDPHAAVERCRRRAQLLQLARLERLGLADAALQDLEPLHLVGEVVLGVVEHLLRNEAALGERLVQLILAPRLGEIGLGLVEVAQVRVAGLRQCELLAAHVVELLLDLGLLLEGRKLQLGVRKHREQLTLSNLGAVLDQLPFDPPALNRVEIDGHERSDSGTKRKEVLEHAALDRRDRQPIGADRLGIRAGSEQPEGQDEKECRRRSSGDQDALVDAPALDHAVHRTAAHGVRAVLRLAQLDQAHCPPPARECPETDRIRPPAGSAAKREPDARANLMPLALQAPCQVIFRTK